MSDKQPWKTSVDHLIGAFRRALIALVPIADELNIPWRDQDAYDDWDNISEVLFHRLVESTLAYAVSDLRLPRYDILLQDYAAFDYIAVQADTDWTGDLAFIGFSTIIEPFDSVKCMQLSARGVALKQSAVRIAYGNVRFSLRRQGMASALITELSIDG